MHDCLVSIGVPVYNGEKWIARCLDSLLSQDYINIEIIISDNSSTDNTLEICKKFRSNDNRVRIIEQESNLGILNNFKEVLRNANGVYFMWAAVDDFWETKFVSSLVNLLHENKNANVAMCKVDRVNNKGEYIDTIEFQGGDDPNRKSYLSMAIGLVSPLKYNLFIYGIFRKKALDDSIDLYPEISSSDRWFLLQHAMASRFAYLDEMLHIRTSHENPYQDRYPVDVFAKNKTHAESKIFDYSSISIVSKIIIFSKIIPWFRKFYLIVVIPYLFYRKTVPGILKLIRWNFEKPSKIFSREYLIYSTSLFLKKIVENFTPEKLRLRLKGIKNFD